MEIYLAIFAVIGLVISLITVFMRIAVIYKEFEDKVDSERIEREKAISRVYGRFDEYKKMLEASFVREEVCKEKHERTKDAIKEIKYKIR